jgi:hypothetical protein
MIAMAVVMMSLFASVRGTFVRTKLHLAPQPKPEAQEVTAATSIPEPKNKEPERELKPWQFAMGQWGQLYQTHRYYYKLENMLSADEMVVREDARSETLAWSRDQSVGGIGARITPVRFVVETSTEGLVEGKRVDLSGKWKVADTMQVDGSTLFVLRRPE